MKDEIGFWCFPSGCMYLKYIQGFMYLKYIQLYFFWFSPFLKYIYPNYLTCSYIGLENLKSAFIQLTKYNIPATQMPNCLFWHLFSILANIQLGFNSERIPQLLNFLRINAHLFAIIFMKLIVQSTNVNQMFPE